MDLSRLRNLCIVAHIDHGKTTLSDRLLERCGAVDARDMRSQYLDSMDIERERGITIKLQSVRLDWKGSVLNLIDTPGHVDFSYEVSRSPRRLRGRGAAGRRRPGDRGPDAGQLLPGARERPRDRRRPQQDRPARRRPRPLRGRDREGARHPGRVGAAHSAPRRARASTSCSTPSSSASPPRSATPTPRSRPSSSTATSTSYRGVVSSHPGHGGHARHRRPPAVPAGRRHPRRRRDRRAPARAHADGVARPRRGRLPHRRHQGRRRGPLGRDGHDAARPGRAARRATATPSRWCSAASTRSTATSSRDLRESLEKLRLNDAASPTSPRPPARSASGSAAASSACCTWRSSTSASSASSTSTSSPPPRRWSTGCTRTDGGYTEISTTPPRCPSRSSIEFIEEPYLTVTILTPSDYTGTLMELCQQRRGEMNKMEYLSPERLELVYRMPLAEVVIDFFDQLKSRTQGYASLDYEPAGYERSHLVKVDVLLNGVPVDAFCTIVHRDKAYDYGRRMAEKLQRADPPPDVRRAHPGGHRRQGHRPRDGEGQAQGRAGQVLRRRHHPQAQAAREAEGGQEADEEHRPRRGPPGSVHLAPSRLDD